MSACIQLATYVALFVSAIATQYAWKRLRTDDRGPLPPGPRSVLGYILKIPAHEYPWVLFSQWGARYHSDIIYFNLLGRHVLVLNSLKSAMDLLEIRGSIYSDRPSTVMSGELVGRKDTVFFVSSPSERHKEYRRIMQGSLNKRAAQLYHSVQMAEIQRLLKGLVHNPGKFRSLIRRNAGAVILNITFGYNVESDEDHLVQLADKCIRISEEAAKPGWLVDSFPILQYLPSWAPGAGFKRKASEWRKEVFQLNDVPFEWMKQAVHLGVAAPSICSRMLMDSGPEMTIQQESLLKWISAGFYAAGTDTTTAVIAIFFWVMMLYTDVQQQAQRELDELLGNNRLPNMEDEPSLPYVCALIKEVYRWCPAGPIALPHRLTQDDEYRGYHIPAGTTVITNRWAMLHDPALYSEPFEFRPERFLGGQNRDPEPDPEPMIFGFGRRSCMGIHIAKASVFLQVSSVLATLDIRRPTDHRGNPISQEVRFATGIVAHPTPFDCSISARSDAARELIMSAVGEGEAQ